MAQEFAKDPDYKYVVLRHSPTGKIFFTWWGKRNLWDIYREKNAEPIRGAVIAANSVSQASQIVEALGGCWAEGSVTPLKGHI